MPPRTQTSVGMETVDQTVARARKLVPRNNQTSTPKVDVSGSTVVSPESLATPSPMQITPAPVDTATAGLQGTLETAQGTTDTFLQDLTAQTQTAEQGKTSSMQAYIDSLLAPGETALTAQQYATEGGVDAIQQELDAVNSQILQEQNSLRRKIERIQSSGGGLASGAEAEINNLERESLAKQADLYVIQMGVQGRFDSAKAIADRAVSAQLEADKQRQDILGILYQDNKEQFTKAEQREFETKQADRNRAIEEQAANKQATYELAIQAQMDGAPTAVVQQMMGAKSKEEALAIGGSYLGAQERRINELNIQKLQQEISGNTFVTPNGEQITVPTFEEFISVKENEQGMTLSPQAREEYRKEYEDETSIMRQAVAVSSLSPIAQEIVNNPRAYYDLTPSVRGEIFEEMARKGVDTTQILSGKKKPLPATQAESLSQASGVKADVEKLYQMLQELPGNGPIGGRLQALDPYHPQRIAIDAQITRIVPGLARGIFNEVGVLTDSDVQRYTDTLANPNMTDEQIEQLHQDTLNKIDQSINTSLSTFGSLGYDLGSFEADVLKVDDLTDDEAYAEYLRITGQTQ